MANKTVEYETIKGTIIPKSIEESNKLITGLVEKIKNYEKEHGRKMKADYDEYTYISQNSDNNLKIVITEAKIYSSNLIDIRRNLAVEYWPNNVVRGQIETDFDKFSNKIFKIEAIVYYDPESSDKKFQEEYKGLVDIVGNYNKK